MYINGRIVSGPLDSFTEVLIPKHVIDLDKVMGVMGELLKCIAIPRMHRQFSYL